MPEKAVVVDPAIFDKDTMLALKRKSYKVDGYAASKPGMTCDQVTLILSCLILYYHHPAQAASPSIVISLPYRALHSIDSIFSTNQVCAASGLSCRIDLLPLLNTCSALNEKFPCHNCVRSFGLEQPAYVSPDAKEGGMQGMCLTSDKPEESQCSSSHESTYRLCACA